MSNILTRLPNHLVYQAIKVELVTVLKDRYAEPKDYLVVTQHDDTKLEFDIPAKGRLVQRVNA